MNFVTFVVVVVLMVAVARVSSTEVESCKKGRKLSDLNDRVKIGNCKKPPCRLRKNTSIQFSLRFNTEGPVESLQNSVKARIAGLDLPFVGVDGVDACNNIYEQDGTTKAKCPLAAGKEYIYKNTIDVLQIYPSVKTTVHWGLESPSGDVICFEVPARITN
ncbi:NPC intracellular cholesterol transporter 2 homolog a [Aethina tumida]|uniref:NPC intracellular cholesterol transporter 2 homolog a n=1 Tax=Aethina tumida TaxID=116153 RepID=UPI00096B5C5F|nr:NPC intracellular cholesterol transporter 2 homolog a [Aethina tumida]